MQYEIVTLPERIAAGVSARTSNREPNVGEVIGGLWSRFFQEGVYEAIPNKADSKALGLYTDYAGNDKSEYTAMAACVVTQDPKSGFAVCKIPAGRYAKFVVRGNMVQAVAVAWQKIWGMDLPRSFLCDFEEYQDDRMEDAEIHIYVGLQEVK